jgi:hypothetical protein
VAKPKIVVHVEVHRSWWNGISTTACGIKTEGSQVKSVSTLFNPVNCPTCAKHPDA